MVAQWVTLMPHSSKVLSPILTSGYCLRGVAFVLPMSMGSLVSSQNRLVCG